MGTPIVQADVTDVATELASMSAAQFEAILAYVNLFDLTATSDTALATGLSDVPGEDAQTDRMARIFLAAHMMTMIKRASTGAAGPLTGESVGGVRRSYGLIAMTGIGSLATTRYGQLFMEVTGMGLTGGGMLV